MGVTATMEDGSRAGDITSKPPVFQLNTGSGAQFSLYDNGLRFQDKVVMYRDLTGLSFHITSSTAGQYGMPVFAGTLYRMCFTSATDTTVVEYYPFDSAATDRSIRDTEDLLSVLYQRIHQLVKPYVVLNLLLQYCAGQSISICNLQLSSKGIMTRSVWDQDNVVEWYRYEKAEFKDQNLHLYRIQEDATLGEFFFCSTDQTNAFVLPDVLNYLQPINGTIDEVARERIATRLAQLP